jgi:hypothetical protein
VEFYKTIEDMPVYNWNKIIEKQLYQYVLIDLKEHKEENELEYKQQFEVLYNEFLDTFGINDHLKSIIELQNEIVLYKIDIALTGDKSLTALQQLAEQKLQKKIEVKKTSTNLVKVHIEKFMGFRIDEKQVTVYEYYNYLKALENGKENQ